MNDELIDIYDENNLPLGISRKRSEAHRDGLWHHAVHIWIFDDRGRILLQLRSKDKEINPERWAPAAGGHVAAGESEIEAAVRETDEEIGIHLQKNDFGDPIIQQCQLRHPNGLTNAEFRYLYFVRHPISEKAIILQKTEVIDFRILSIDDMEKAYDEKPESFSFENEGYWKNAVSILRSRLRNDDNDL